MSKEPLGDKLDDFRTQYKAEQAALRQRIAALERERDQLAAALEPLKEALALYATLSELMPGLPLKLSPAAVEAVRRSIELRPEQILAARDLAQQEKGGREALKSIGCTCKSHVWGDGGYEHFDWCAINKSRTWTPSERREENKQEKQDA